MYKLSPSKAHRYLQCPMSLKFDVEFVENEITKRGSNLHRYAELLLTNKEEEAQKLSDEMNMNNYEYNIIRGYINHIYEEMALLMTDKKTIEIKQSIDLYGNKINLIMDASIKNKDTASIIDLKTGRNKIEPAENEQLLFYALATILNDKNIKNFRLIISQYGNKYVYETNKDKVIDFFFEKREIFDAINNNKLYYCPSEKACKYCANKEECRARAEWIIYGKVGLYDPI